MRSFSIENDIIKIFDNRYEKIPLTQDEIVSRYASICTCAAFRMCICELVEKGDLVAHNEDDSTKETCYELSPSPRSKLELYKEATCTYLKVLDGDPCKTTHITAHLGESLKFARSALVELCLEGKVVWTGEGRDTHYYWKDDAPSEVVEAFENYLNARKVLTHM